MTLNASTLTAYELIGAYIAACAVAWLASVLIARRRLPVAGDPRVALEGLDRYHHAYLVGGATRAVDAALVSLVHEGRIVLADGRLRSGPTAPALELAGENVFRGRATEVQDHALDRAVLDEVSAAGADGCERSAVMRAAAARAFELEPSLVDRNLLMPPRRHRRLVRLSKAPLVAVWGAGVVWLILGIAFGGFGVPTLLLGASGAVFWQRTAPARRTRLGDRAVAQLRTSHASLATRARSAPEQLTGPEMAPIFALYGAADLPGAARRVAALAEPADHGTRKLRDSSDPDLHLYRQVDVSTEIGPDS